MNRFERLNPELKKKMLAIGRDQGYSEAEVKQEYEDAQMAIHGQASVRNNDILTRGFSCGSRRLSGNKNIEKCSR